MADEQDVEREKARATRTLVEIERRVRELEVRVEALERDRQGEEAD